jgi:alanyl-tRNA synthetase
VKEIINEEEAQFLKTLTRGHRLLTRTIDKLGKTSSVLPGLSISTLSFYHSVILDNI